MSDDATKVFDADQVLVQFFGVSISKGRGASGYAAGGPFIEYEQDGPDFTYKKGVDGSVLRSKTNEPVTIVTVHLMQSSSSNAVFSAMLNKDKRSSNGAGIGTGVVQDLQGTSIFETERCWVEGPPKVVYGPEGEGRDWRIICTQSERLDGGN